VVAKTAVLFSLAALSVGRGSSLALWWITRDEESDSHNDQLTMMSIGELRVGG
jgi:hypothetical protein